MSNCENNKERFNERFKDKIILVKIALERL